MPLRCDCYPGCWGDHSAAWPTLYFHPDRGREAQLFCRDHFTYGTYVIWGPNAIRFETEKDLATLREYLSRLR